MGALKLSYYQQEQGLLEKNPFFLDKGLEKKGIAEKNRLSSYRYGFNGMEKDDEVTNQSGTSYDFGARFYNPRVGRWLSRDPLAKKQPGWSPYKAMFDNPIYWLDPNGETEYAVFIYTDKMGKSVAIKKAISEKIMTDGKMHPNAVGKVNRYYNYESVTEYTQTADGEYIVKSYYKILTDGPIRDEDQIWNGNSEKKWDTQKEGDNIVNGGWSLVTEEGGPDPTKMKARNMVETIDVGGLLMLLGGAPGKGTTISLGENLNGLSKMFDKVIDAAEEARKNKTAQGKDSNSNNDNAAQTDSTDVDMGDGTVMRTATDSLNANGDWPTKGSSRKLPQKTANSK